MDFIQQAVVWIAPLADFIGWTAVTATMFMRLPFMKVDPSKYGPFVQGLFRVLQWLPTIGVNPMTDEMKAAVEKATAK